MTELREKINNIVEEKRTKIIPENIKAGVQVFDITGSYTSDANATAEDIAKDKTAYVNGEKINGTLEAVDTRDADATANDILMGKTAYVANRKITGTYEGGSGDAILTDTIKAGSINEPGILSSIEEITKPLTLQGSSTEFMFNYCRALKTAPQLETSNATKMTAMFSNCINLISVPQYDTNKVVEMSSMFANCNNLEEIPQLDTSNVTNMTNMFKGCVKITTIPQFNTAKLLYMQNTFQECVNLEEIPQLDTSNVKSMGGLFYGCTKLPTIPQLETNNVTNMSSMFYNCQKLITVPEIDTANVTTMSNMFYNCQKLTTVPVFYLGKVTGSGMNSMFKYCRELADESLNNIMASCISAIKITSASYKTLKYIGINSDQATRCQSLSNYQAFVDAGLTTGY